MTIPSKARPAIVAVVALVLVAGATALMLAGGDSTADDDRTVGATESVGTAPAPTTTVDPAVVAAEVEAAEKEAEFVAWLVGAAPLLEEDSALHNELGVASQAGSFDRTCEINVAILEQAGRLKSYEGSPEPEVGIRWSAYARASESRSRNAVEGCAAVNSGDLYAAQSAVDKTATLTTARNGAFDDLQVALAERMS